MDNLERRWALSCDPRASGNATKELAFYPNSLINPKYLERRWALPTNSIALRNAINDPVWYTNIIYI